MPVLGPTFDKDESTSHRGYTGEEQARKKRNSSTGISPLRPSPLAHQQIIALAYSTRTTKNFRAGCTRSPLRGSRFVVVAFEEHMRDDARLD